MQVKPEACLTFGPLGLFIHPSACTVTRPHRLFVFSGRNYVYIHVTTDHCYLKKKKKRKEEAGDTRRLKEEGEGGSDWTSTLLLTFQSRWQNLRTRSSNANRTLFETEKLFPHSSALTVPWTWPECEIKSAVVCLHQSVRPQGDGHK